MVWLVALFFVAEARLTVRVRPAVAAFVAWVADVLRAGALDDEVRLPDLVDVRFAVVWAVPALAARVDVPLDRVRVGAEADERVREPALADLAGLPAVDVLFDGLPAAAPVFFRLAGAALRVDVPDRGLICLGMMSWPCDVSLGDADPFSAHPKVRQATSHPRDDEQRPP